MKSFTLFCSLNDEEIRAISATKPEAAFGLTDEQLRVWLNSQVEASIKEAVDKYERMVMRVKVETVIELTPMERLAIARMQNEGQFDLDQSPATPEECEKFLVEYLQAAVEIAVDCYGEEVMIRGRSPLPNQMRLPLNFDVTEEHWFELKNGKNSQTHYFENTDSKKTLCGMNRQPGEFSPKRFRCIKCRKKLGE